MRKIYQKAGSVELVLAAVFLSACCVLIFLSALARSFGKPINWSQDLSLFLFAWSVFLGADVALRRDKLVRVELLVNRFPPGAAQIIEALCYLIILAFLASLIYYGIKLSFISSRRVFQGIPGFSYTWVIISVPIGSALMLMTVIRKLALIIGIIKPSNSGEVQK